MGNETAPLDAMAFYVKVRELAARRFPGREVGFSANLFGAHSPACDVDKWCPAKLRDGALFIDLQDGRTIPIEKAQNWRFKLRGDGPFTEVLTFPNWPECRNFSPDAVVADLIRHAGHTGNLCVA